MRPADQVRRCDDDNAIQRPFDSVFFSFLLLLTLLLSVLLLLLDCVVLEKLLC